MNFSLVAILVFISPTLSEIREDLFPPFPKLRSIFSNVKKRQGDGGYLEQCGIVDFGMKNLGTVNVLAFFDASWQYSHRQAAMLKELKGRFERSGMMDISFFVINSTPSTIIEQGEIEIEEETWKAISPDEAEGFPLVETSLESLNKTLGPEFYLIEDNYQLQIWKKLHASRDQILVVDGCGKLTYQVIVPWSILHFPYVKAAILSTYKDEACGPCKSVSEKIIKKVEPEKIEGGEMETNESKTMRSETEEITTEGLETSNGEVTTPLKIKETTTEEIKTDVDETTIPLRIEEITTKEIKISEVETIVALEEEEEEKVEGMKTIDDTTTIQSENLERTTEQIEKDGTMTSPSRIEETRTEQVKTDATRITPSDIEVEKTGEMKMADDTTTTQLENQEITTEETKRDITRFIPLEEEETTTEQFITDTRTTVPFEIEEATEEIRRADFTTSTQLENQDIVTEQTEEDDEITITSKMEEKTTEELKIDTTRTTTQLEIPGKTTQPTNTDETMNTPSEIEEKTTEEMRTDFSANDDSSFEEKNMKSEKTRQEAETLTPTLDLENNSEDLEHILSKFPNVRSISTGIYKNQMSLDQNSEKGSTESGENSKVVPIRIILRAPHLDIYENSLIKHDYLILKSGDPDVHDHFDQGIQINSLGRKADFEEGSADFENRDIWKIENRDLLNQKEVDVKAKNENETRNGWYGFHVKIDNGNDDENGNKVSRKIKKRIFGKDESPGLYGEVADYWRNDGIENFYDEAFYTEEDDKNYDMEKEPEDDLDISQVSKSEYSPNGTEGENILGGHNETNAGSSINNAREEEAKSKLIAHYSKLLPWIYYVLN